MESEKRKNNLSLTKEQQEEIKQQKSMYSMLYKANFQEQKQLIM